MTPLSDVSSMGWVTSKVPPSRLGLENSPPSHVKKMIKMDIFECPSHTATISIHQGFYHDPDTLWDPWIISKGTAYYF